MVKQSDPITCAGREFRAAEVAVVQEVVDACSGISRSELASTVCELLKWRRASGGLKSRECLDLLEHLEEAGLLALPEKRRTKPVGAHTRVPITSAGDAVAPMVLPLRELQPLGLERVRTDADRRLFRELVGRHHYLGHAVPFGAHLRYLVRAGGREAGRVLGCLQFSSPAWRLAPRDVWIGWDESSRRRNLQRVVSNSRFLVLPWVRVENLASAVLALAARQVSRDWQGQYAIEPCLLETLVDPRRFHGGCYRAANWLEVGVSAGRGRMDRKHERHDAAPKTVFVYPLRRDAARLLREE